ncbi:MAG: RteC domain-containing protein [Dysgonamonadaceae bacterium]|nr:RteC domain-containing protein [Dysgonamonadaceae bacterium]
MVRYLQKAIGIVDKQMELVRRQMQMEATAQNCPFSRQSQTCRKLKWTGSIIDWVELNYALHEVRKINNGEISLRELFQLMGEIFDFDVKEFANYFRNIKGRLEENRTKFLDELKKALVRKMKDSDRKPSRK